MNEHEGYIGAVDQAKAYVAGDLEYTPEVMRWMIRELLLLLDER